MKKNNLVFVELLLVIIASLTAAYFFLFLDKNFIYVNSFFPWDSAEYLKALKNYEHSYPAYKVGSPFNERVLFPFFVYKLSLIFKLEYINSCLFLNLFSSIISFLIFFIISVNSSLLVVWLLYTL